MDEKAFIEYLAKVDTRLEKAWNRLIDELARIGVSISDVDTSKDFFSFDDHPQVREAVDEVLKQYHATVKNLVTTGMMQAYNGSWSAATALLGDYSILAGSSSIAVRDRARAAYIASRQKSKHGLTLSQRVWNCTYQTKAEFEAAISDDILDALGSGMSAERLGRKVRHMLQNPDMMYRRYHQKKKLHNGQKVDVVEWRRRYVDDAGKVHFVKEDLEHTGQGVYRSSRKNALRMAATEINMAYRSADCTRYSGEPFVRAIEIRLSNNHTCNGKPFHDLCDDLAGVYPKTFDWKGWHPKCKCIMIPLLIPREEMREARKLPEDQWKAYKPKGLVTGMPDNFKLWMAENEEKLERAKSKPFFIRDNQPLIYGVSGQEE